MQKFKEKVLKIVKGIPNGEVKTYSEIALLAGNPKAARAVGNIIHSSEKNVPCHRVVSKAGRLSSNFGKGGILKQKELLEKEGHLVENFKIKS